MDTAAYHEGERCFLLVSASRDSLIQIYDANSDFEEIQIIEVHEAPVTFVQFLAEDDGLALISAGVDK